MLRSELLAQLQTTGNNYTVGLAAISLFIDERSLQLLRTKHVSFLSQRTGHETIDFDRLADLLENEANRDVLLEEFLKMLTRALIKESFELVRTYCRQTRQFAKLKDLSWYHFVRLVRNAVSHDFMFRFRPHDRDLLPVSWRDLAITSHMEGEDLSASGFGKIQARLLFQDLHSLVTDSLE